MLDDDAGDVVLLGVADDGIVVALVAGAVDVGVVFLDAAVIQTQGDKAVLDGLREVLSVLGDGGDAGAVVGEPHLGTMGIRRVGRVDVDAHEHRGTRGDGVGDAALEAFGLVVVVIGEVGAISGIVACHVDAHAGVGLQLVAACLGNLERELLFAQTLALGTGRLVVVAGVEGDDKARKLRCGLALGVGGGIDGHGVEHDVGDARYVERVLDALCLHKLARGVDGIGGEVGDRFGRLRNIEHIRAGRKREIHRMLATVGKGVREGPQRRGALAEQRRVDVEEHGLPVDGGNLNLNFTVRRGKGELGGRDLACLIGKHERDLLGLALLQACLGNVHQGERLFGSEGCLGGRVVWRCRVIRRSRLAGLGGGLLFLGLVRRRLLALLSVGGIGLGLGVDIALGGVTRRGIRGRLSRSGCVRILLIGPFLDGGSRSDLVYRGLLNLIGKCLGGGHESTENHRPAHKARKGKIGNGMFCHRVLLTSRMAPRDARRRVRKVNKSTWHGTIPMPGA